MKQMPQISKYMSASPHTIGSDISIQKAKEMMRESHIRHLPVQEGGHLVGVLSDRDVKLASGFEGYEKMKVDDVMTPDPYRVKPEAELDKVISEMVEHRYGCAIVEQSNGKVVGIFTATDGLRVLDELLQTNYKARF